MVIYGKKVHQYYSYNNKTKNSTNSIKASYHFTKTYHAKTTTTTVTIMIMSSHFLVLFCFSEWNIGIVKGKIAIHS